jgi:8-oxo-dGTP pyrophosphatase MutT (NUDIX family)
MTSSTPPLREAARAIVLDADDRVMLLRYDEEGGFWATPGGSLEDGEDHATATLRELSEELGIDEKAVELGGTSRSAARTTSSATVRSARWRSTSSPESPQPTSTRPGHRSPTTSANTAGGPSPNYAPRPRRSTRSVSPT